MTRWELKEDKDTSWWHCGRPGYWEGEDVYCSKCQEKMEERDRKGKPMKPINFYEVTDSKGVDAVWGGSSALQAVEWFRRSLDYRLFVSVWDEQDPEEPKLIIDKIEVSNLITATILDERERGYR